MEQTFETKFKITGKIKYEMESEDGMINNAIADNEAVRLLYEALSSAGSINMDSIKIETIDTDEVHSTE